MPGTIRQWSEGAVEPGQLAFELLHEQIRHNLAIVRVIGRATDWDGIIQVQEDFVRTSFERMHLFTACWLDLLQPKTASNILGR
jgi:hypothetical protein